MARKRANSLSNLLFYSAMLVPLDLSMWTQTKFPFKDFPEIRNLSKSEISIASKNNIGGYAYKLPQAIAFDAKINIDLSWDILKFTKKQASFPMKKEEDDSVLRIGLILSDSEKKAEIPWMVRRKIPIKKPISYVIYISPNQEEESVAMSCGRSPHNNYSLYCFVPSTKGMNHRSVDGLHREFNKFFPEAKKQLSLEALWLLVDTDDTQSETEAILKTIILKY